MPAITSALRALRFSGRLIVIQNACPRFSSTTLLSVIALLVLFRRSRTLTAGRRQTARRIYAAGIAGGAAFFTQTLLSWNAAPPTGATASAPVSVLIPRPPMWALFGWIDSAINTPRRRP